MQSLKNLFMVTGFVLLFVLGLAFFVSFDERLDSAEWTSHDPSAARSESSVKNKNSSKDRILEDSTVISKTNKVEDEPSALMNDPAISKAWGLKKADAGRAWSVSHGSRDIVVAVIDTGIDTNHEDLKKNLWVNPGETGLDAKGRNKATNGIDDDKNGFIDDVNGWNFASNNSDLTDNHGHGTHIAGIIGAEGGNGKGISGIAPKVSLMILKYFDPKKANTDNLKSTIAAIRYAVEKGAHIINYSGGGTDFSQDEFNAVAEAEKKGILFVAAAGNERSNSDKFHYYPADYKLSNIISVTAIDQNTEVLPSSNFGTETVHIAAPGQNILSSIPGNAYGQMTGTSQATAFVTGAGVLIMANLPRYVYKASEVKKYILATGDSVEGLAEKTRTSRQLNLFKCLTILDKDLSATGLVLSDADKVQGITTSGADGTRQNLSEDDPNNPVRGISNFGKSLIENLKNKKKIRGDLIGTGQDPSK